MRTRPVAARPALLAALLCLLGALLAAAPAAAHSEDGIMEVTIAESEAPLEITIEVGIIYADDGHLSIDAEVSATATGPDDEEVGPVDLPNISDALYGTTFEVPAPGMWSVSIVSDNPEANAEADVVVEDVPATTEPPETTTTTEATTTTAPATTTTEATETDDDATDETDETIADATDDEDNGDDGNLGLIIAIVVLGLAAVAAVVFLATRTRGAGAGEDAAGEIDG